MFERLPFPPSDGKAGEDVVRPRRRCRTAPGSAGLGPSAVGGHVWRQTTDPAARLSRELQQNCREERPGEALILAQIGAKSRFKASD